MNRLTLTYLLIFFISSFFILSRANAETSGQNDLVDQIQQAINFHYEGKYDESQQILDDLPKSPSDNLSIVDWEVSQIIQSLNYIATTSCLNTEKLIENIQNTAITGEEYSFFFDLIIMQSDCLEGAEKHNEKIKLIKKIYPFFEKQETFTQELDATFIRSIADGLRIGEGVEAEAQYVYGEAHRFDFSNGFKSEFYERAINAYLDISRPKDALLIALQFEEELEASDDFWFRDVPLSQILIAKAYADLERFDDSEIAASKAFKSYLTLQATAEEEYYEVLNPDNEVEINFNEYLAIEDAYILNHLGLLLDRQWRFGEAAAAYQLGIKIVEHNHESLEDVGFYLDLVANYSHLLSFMEGQEEKAKRFLEKFFKSNSELLEDHPLQHANLLNVLAILYGNSQRLEQAKKTFIKGIDLLDTSELSSTEMLVIRAQLLNNISTLELGHKEIEHYSLRAIRDLEAYEADQASIGQAYANLGVFYLESNDDKKAIETLGQLANSIEIDQNLSSVINFLNAILAHQLDHEFLEQTQLERLIDWNIKYHESSIQGLSPKDIHVWLPNLQTNWYLAGNTFDAIIDYCKRYDCSDEFFFQTLFDLIQITDFSIISVAQQASHNLTPEQQKIFVEFVADYFHKPNLVNRTSRNKDIAELVKELQQKHVSASIAAFDKSQNFTLFNGSELTAPKGGVIVKFFDTGKHFYRIDITHSSKKIIRLDANGEQISALFKNLKSGLFNSTPKKIDKELEQLGTLLFADLSFDINSINTIYYSPEISMRLIPPNLLKIKGRHIADYAAVVTLPSFTSSFLSITSHDNEYDLAFLGFGAPKFTGEGFEPNDTEFRKKLLRGILKSETILEKFPPLHGAAEELRLSGKILKGLGDTVVIAGGQATKKRVLDLLSKKSSRLISFATHGVPAVETGMGLYPSLLFNAENEANENGLLSTKDILKTPIKAEVIYLSTCDSAASNTEQSRAWEGFVNSFLFAGAQSVIASSWKIEDQAAKKLHTIFSKSLTKGLKPRFAFANALRELKLNENFSHPMYWGAFSTFGGLRQ